MRPEDRSSASVRCRSGRRNGDQSTNAKMSAYIPPNVSVAIEAEGEAEVEAEVEVETEVEAEVEVELPSCCSCSSRVPAKGSCKKSIANSAASLERLKNQKARNTDLMACGGGA